MMKIYIYLECFCGSGLGILHHVLLCLYIYLYEYEHMNIYFTLQIIMVSYIIDSIVILVQFQTLFQLAPMLLNA